MFVKVTRLMKPSQGMDVCEKIICKYNFWVKVSDYQIIWTYRGLICYVWTTENSFREIIVRLDKKIMLHNNEATQSEIIRTRSSSSSSIRLLFSHKNLAIFYGVKFYGWVLLAFFLVSPKGLRCVEAWGFLRHR
jgi:hypothetical protein